MGVMACDRVDCEEVMCDRLILGGRSYICHGCWDELLAFKETWPQEMTKLEVRKSIERFMDRIPPGTASTENCDVDAEFRRLTSGS